MWVKKGRRVTPRAELEPGASSDAPPTTSWLTSYFEIIGNRTIYPDDGDPLRHGVP
jgi:hypothetical protein